MGRKKKEETNRKGESYRLRLTLDQKKRLDVLAEATGKTRSELLRYGLELVWEEYFCGTFIGPF